MSTTDPTLSAITIDNKDLSTTSFNEFESFDSIFDALRWKQIRTRIPICWKRLLHSRYMLANIVYLIYSIAILFINFHPSFNQKLTDSSSSIFDLSRLYIILSILHLISASLYLWAWQGRSWLDIIMIPEYLNHIEAGLYLWSACWYSKLDGIHGYYTLAIHKIELSAAIIELIASFGWILSWYMTYTRTLGHGFTLDDPDTIAYLSTTISSIIYIIYNIDIYINPEQYGKNIIYKYADIIYFLGACYYILAALRDENCFWFLPLAGQYGIASDKIHIETKELPQYGKKPILLTDLCQRQSSHEQFHNRNELHMENSIVN